MQADAASSRLRTDAHHLDAIEQLAVAPAHRRFDRDGTHRHAHATRLRAVERPLDFRPREARAVGRERQQREAAQRRARIAGVVVHVAHVLDDHAVPIPGERSQREMIGERAGGHEERPLLAQQASEPGFEFLDDAAHAVDVRRRLPGRAQACQLGGRFGRREGKAVLFEMDDRRTSGRTFLWRAHGGQWYAERRSGGEQFQKLAAREVFHGQLVAEDGWRSRRVFRALATCALRRDYSS